jgi:hypothetical protein
MTLRPSTVPARGDGLPTKHEAKLPTTPTVAASSDMFGLSMDWSPGPNSALPNGTTETTDRESVPRGPRDLLPATLANGRVIQKPVGLVFALQSPPLRASTAGDMPDTRSDVELLSDAKLYGLCLFCGTPRMTNQDGRADVKREALICPNEECAAMRAIIVPPSS